MDINESTKFLNHDEEQYLNRFGTLIRETIQDYNINTGCNTHRTRYVLTHGEATLVFYVLGNGNYELRGYVTTDYLKDYNHVSESTCIGFQIKTLLKRGIACLEAIGRFRDKPYLRRSAQEVLDMIKESK